MPATTLKLPHKSLSTSTTLPVVGLPASGLIRISGHQNGEPYFGASGGNRFDAPGWKRGISEYACCYLGLTFEVALAESLLHDAIPVNGEFPVARTEIDRRWVHRFEGELKLLNLTGALLKKMGGHAGLAGTSSYVKTQKWALAVYDNPLQVDGFIYMSRHLNDEKAVVLFDRARAKLKPIGTPIKLMHAPEMIGAMNLFNIVPA